MCTLVSIITPLFNSENYLKECIDSVLRQTYSKWEMIIVDDFSTDDSYGIAAEYVKIDKRIKLFRLSKNMGAGVARNYAIEKAKGSIIAFLDSDDLWHPKKLELHLAEMERNKAAFSHTSYGYILNDGTVSNKISRVSKELVTYKDLLRYTEISCLTAMYDVRVLGKMYMPNYRKKQDYGLWLNILKTGVHSLPVDIPLAWYRQVKGSSTSKKYKLVFQHYSFLRDSQDLGVFKSVLYTLFWITNGIRKYYI